MQQFFPKTKQATSDVSVHDAILGREVDLHLRLLHDDVERRAGSVLQPVTHGVARHGVLVRLGALEEVLAQTAGSMATWP